MIVAAPTPKKRRTRKPLAQVNGNAPRLRGAASRQFGRNAGTKRKQERIDRDSLSFDSSSFDGSINPSHLTVGGGPLYTSNSDEHEFKLTMGDFGRKRKLGIFRDAEEEDSPGMSIFIYF